MNKPLTQTTKPISILLAVLSAAIATAAAEDSAQSATSAGANLALVATSSTSFVSGHETITALNDGATPANSNDKSHGAYGNWPRTGTQWVQYRLAPANLHRQD